MCLLGCGRIVDPNTFFPTGAVPAQGPHRPGAPGADPLARIGGPLGQTRGVNPRTLVLLGATASGKSSLAVSAAVELGRRGTPAEIVNADSMLVYRGMDVGTAKPTPAERRGVPHHLVDIMEVTETASVALFQQLARAAIADCHDRGVLPIVVGGSALYIRAIVDRFEFPGTDPAVRARWEAELARRGAAELYAELVRRAPQAAAGILPGNGRRIVRALEVIELTGDFASTLPTWEYALPAVTQIGLDLPRERMDARIEQRVDQMWADGFVAEVEGLIPRGLRRGRTASRALGYRQILLSLDGHLTEAEARRQTVTGTRRFARKQLGWFRRDERIRWLPAEGGALDRLLEMVG